MHTTACPVTWEAECTVGQIGPIPVRDKPVGPVAHSRPCLQDDLKEAALAITLTGFIAPGRHVERFEAAMAHMHGAPGAVATNSGTAALHLALLALEIGPGDEVIVPSFVCTAVLNAVRYVGATPVLADIDERTFNLAAVDVAPRISSRTKALIVPHMFGAPADILALRSFGVPIIEDCAQSLGATVGNEPVGSFGDLAVFSFYATKVITTGEGGMVLARDPSLVARMRDLRDYDEKDRYVTRYNYHMSDLAAAIGYRQLQRLPDFLARRRALASFYDHCLSALPLHSPAPVPGSIYYRYVVRMEALPYWQRTLEDAGVQCKRPVYKPLHHYLGGQFPITERVYQTALSLPLYPALSDEEAWHVLGALVEGGHRFQECLTHDDTTTLASLADGQSGDQLPKTVLEECH
jgi:perosamine synthetase